MGKIKAWFRRQSSKGISAPETSSDSLSSLPVSAHSISPTVSDEPAQSPSQDDPASPVVLSELQPKATTRPLQSLLTGSTNLSTGPTTKQQGVISTVEAAPWKQDLWIQARRFLKDEEISLLDSAAGGADVSTGLNGLLQLAAEKRRLSEEKAWKLHFGGRRIVIKDVANKIVSWLDSFKEVGDIVAQADPIHIGVPWSIISIVLSVVTADQEQMGLVLIGLEQITCLMTRCRVFQFLYLENIEPKHEIQRKGMVDLCESIARLYAKLFSFLAYYIRLLDTKSFVRKLTAFVEPNFVSDKLTEISASEQRVVVDADICEKHISMQAIRNIQGSLNNSRTLLRNMKESFDNQMTLFRNKLDDDERCQIFQWISDIPYENDHYTAQKGRVSNTGDWLLRHPNYVEWKTSEKSVLMWMNGVPGAGKTKLSSKIVDDLSSGLESIESRDVRFAYFYCDRNRSDHQDPVAILRSLIRQLCAPVDDATIETCVEEKYKERKRKGFAQDRLLSEECNDILLKILSDNTESYIVLDGLDECNRDTRHVLMDILDHVLNRSNRPVKILIASRRDEDLRQRYQGVTHLEVTANDNQADIERFVLDRMEQSDFCRTKLSPKVRKMILHTFHDKSQGMFQWAALHIGELLQLKRNSDIEKYLDELPKGLEAAYDALYRQISSQIGSKKDVAFAAFRILMVSWKPLHPYELAIAVTQDPDRDFEVDEDVDIGYVLEACHNLLVITDGTTEKEPRMNSKPTHVLPGSMEGYQCQTLQEAKAEAFASAYSDGSGITPSSICKFSHLSVQEYLETKHWTVEKCNAFMVGICLRTLVCLQRPESNAGNSHRGNNGSGGEFEDTPTVLCISESKRDNRVKIVRTPSEDDASKNHSTSCIMEKEDQAMEKSATHQLGRDRSSPVEVAQRQTPALPPFEWYLEFVDTHSHRDDASCISHEFDPFVESHSNTALEEWIFYCAHGLVHHSKAMDAASGLSGASGFVQQALWSRLIGDIDCASSHYQAWACLAQNEAISRPIEESNSVWNTARHINLRSKIRPRSRPVFGCVLLGLNHILGPWLEEGSVDPNDCNADGDSLLYLATDAGQLETCKLLLKHGAEPNFAGQRLLSLVDLAIHALRVDLLRVLLEGGANPNATAISILQKQGKSYKGQGLECDTPMVQVVRANSIEMASALLEAGASPWSRLPFSTQPLELAVERSQTDMVSKILQYLPKESEWEYKGTLWWALGMVDRTSPSAVVMMKLLMSHLGSVTSGSYLHYALKEEQWDYAEALIEAGGHVDMRAPRLEDNEDTALLALCRVKEATLERARKLLEWGADVNARDIHGRSPLHLCMRYPMIYDVAAPEKPERPDVVEDRDRDDTEASKVESQESRLETIKELLKHGADPNLADGTGVSALGAALAYGIVTPEVIQLLVDHGARVDVDLETKGNRMGPLDVLCLHDIPSPEHTSETGTGSTGETGLAAVRDIIHKAGGRHVSAEGYEGWDDEAKLTWLKKASVGVCDAPINTRCFTGRVGAGEACLRSGIDVQARLSGPRTEPPESTSADA